MEPIGKLLNPKNDYVFHRIFGHSGNEEITKDLLESITKENITDITLDCNPITEKDLFDDKIGILDIKVKLNSIINCNIEMQIIDEKNIEKRILFCWCKMYISSIKEGRDYSKLEKCIVILFADFNIEKLKEISKYITKWSIREEEKSRIILTDVLEIYIIELKKVKENIQDETMLSLWLKFINYPEVISNMENEAIKQARDVLKEISQEKREKKLTEIREKYIMDQKAIEDLGFDKGMQEGKRQKNLEIAKKMKSENIDVCIISKITGLDKEQIENL